MDLISRYVIFTPSPCGQKGDDKKGEANLNGKSKIEQPRCPKTAGVAPISEVQ